MSKLRDGSSVKQAQYEEHVQRGRKAVFSLLRAYTENGVSRKEAAKKLFTLSSGECNTTDGERWFDEGLRAQLNDLGFKEE